MISLHSWNWPVIGAVILDLWLWAGIVYVIRAFWRD